MNACLRVAVASKDGIAVNQHFGHARHFFIYRVSQDGHVLLEKRDVALYCHGHRADQNAMQNILHAIRDCDAVMIARIGDGAAEKLRHVGVTPVDDYAYLAIAGSLLDYYRQRCPARVLS